jgi:hypothetical protein
MDYDEYEPDPPEADELPRPPDPKVAEAKAVIMAKFLGEGSNVFYSRQLEIWLEKQFYHWIAKKALRELVADRKIGFIEERLEHHKAHFFYPRQHRYPRRQIKEIIGLIATFSEPGFTRAVGHHGEMLVESGFARTGFRILQQKVRAVDRRQWKETNHDLDFLIVRDGIRYGVEVKNQLGYIDMTEFGIKLKMCAYWGIRPMFITRNMPSSYMYAVHEAGGYSLLTDNQNYPLLANALAKTVKTTLKLPVAVIQRFPDTALNRFEKWHTDHLEAD